MGVIAWPRQHWLQTLIRVRVALADRDTSPRRRDVITPSDPASAPDADFGRIYRSETPWLVRFFRGQLGNNEDAQDMTQETMMRFLRAAPSARIETPQAYLRRIAVNLLRDRFVHSSNRLTNLSVPLIEGLDAADDFDQHRAAVGQQELNAWEAVLEELNPRTLEVFLLSRVDGFTYQEIAERLDTTTRSVRRHMQKAIAHVARHRGHL